MGRDSEAHGQEPTVIARPPSPHSAAAPAVPPQWMAATSPTIDRREDG